jgi:hypothetical protein
MFLQNSIIILININKFVGKRFEDIELVRWIYLPLKIRGCYVKLEVLLIPNHAFEHVNEIINKATYVVT